MVKDKKMQKKTEKGQKKHLKICEIASKDNTTPENILKIQQQKNKDMKRPENKRKDTKRKSKTRKAKRIQ